MPGEVLKTLVSDELLEKCFGPRFGKNGRNGPKLKACTGLPQSEVLHFFQVIDGHEKPVNGTFGATFPRALYAERFLKKRINWAAYAHERHRNQIRTAKTRGDSRPTGPPVIRPKRVYTPPATLVLEPLQPTSDSEQKGSPSEHKSQCGAEVLPKEQLVGEGDIDVTDCKENAGFTDGGITKFKKNSAPEGSTSPGIIVRSKMPGVEELRGDILVRKRRVETLRNEVKAVMDAIENNCKKLEETEETITRAEESLKKEKLLRFHCVNFMPTSCGHAYHPACLMALIARSAEPKCLECYESFHPDWCESWGIDTKEEHRKKWEADLGLQRQRDALSDCIRDLYQKTPNVLSDRRKVEREKRQRFTQKYTAAGVERSSAVSTSTTRVRAHILAASIPESEAWADDHPSCRSTIRSSLTDEREGDVNVPQTRSKKGKRPGSKGYTESTRKVRTRSYVSEAEMCTGIGSPGPKTKYFVKPLRECRTPDAPANTGVSSSSIMATKKLFT
ncbi:hypothetical protein R1sor_027057 [Riccia sorocarpa]|uniref:RING-type domain-containing protein n=1 Tax=Riccia sorocarpa TaxID=122646 RepID=A0ABD3GHC7_9MARC